MQPHVSLQDTGSHSSIYCNLGNSIHCKRYPTCCALSPCPPLYSMPTTCVVPSVELHLHSPIARYIMYVCNKMICINYLYKYVHSCMKCTAVCNDLTCIANYSMCFVCNHNHNTHNIIMSLSHSFDPAFAIEHINYMCQTGRHALYKL